MNLCRYHVVAVVVFVACITTAYFAANPVQARQQSKDEQLIREARARSNAAIRAHDPEAMARLWMEDVHVVRSTGAQVAGREPNRQRMAQQFASRPIPSTSANPQQSTCTYRGQWRRSVANGLPDGLSRTALLPWRERTWLSGAESTGHG